MIEFALTANVIVFAAVVILLYWRGYINVFSGLFIYVAFHFITFVQRPIAVYLFDLRSEFIFMTYMPTDDVFIQTILVSNVGLLSFIFGYLFILRFTPMIPNFRPPAASEAEKKSLITAFVILSPLILYSFYLAVITKFYHDVGIVEDLRDLSVRIDPVTGVALFSDTSAYVVFARNLALPFAGYFMIVNRGRWWSTLPLAVCALIALQTGGRWEMVISVVVAIMIVLYFKRHLLPRARHCVIFAAILFLFVAIGQNRGLINEVLLGGQFDFKFDLETSSFGEHPDFANFEFLTYVIGKVPQASRTWSYFTQYLGLFTQPIPRVLWPDKPIGSPISLVNLQAYGRFSTRTTSLVGDGWMSLGYPGVIVTLGLAGAFYGWIYRRFCSPSISIFFFCGYFWMVALLIQWARDGGIKIFDFYFFSLMPLALAFALNRLLWQAGDHGRRRVSGSLTGRKSPLRYD